MTDYQRTKRLHTWAACGIMIFMFLMVTIVGPSL